MKKIVAFLSGRKTYIIAVACIAYACLVFFKVPKVPGPDQLAVMMTTIGALAIGFRAALQKVIDSLQPLVKT